MDKKKKILLDYDDIFQVKVNLNIPVLNRVKQTRFKFAPFYKRRAQVSSIVQQFFGSFQNIKYKKFKYFTMFSHSM